MRNRDQLRIQKQQQCEEKIASIYRQLPELERLDQTIGQKNIAMIRAGIMQKNTEAQKILQNEIENLMKQRHQLLKENGMDECIYEPEWDCPHCQDRGYTEPGVLCSCYQKERLDDLFLRSGMSEAMRGFTFSNFETRYYTNPADMDGKVQWCRQFAKQIQSGECSQCLFLTGGVGRGKTHLSAAIANGVLEGGKTVIYRRAADLFELIRQYRYEENRQKFEEMLEQLRTCDLLVIDDLGAERTTEFVVEQLVILLEERNYRNKPWIISSNLNINEIIQTYNDRTADRILDRAVLFKLDMPESIRVAKAKERMNQF